MEKKYLVAGCKGWTERAFKEILASYPGQWDYIGDKADLTVERLDAYQPRYVFFLHWSWKVPETIIENFECVCFHMTDVPFGRGGSPLQNLIIRGKRETKLTALRMVNDFDAGPVYVKENLCLEGNAEEIYIRATRLACDLIKKIVEEQPEPLPQSGEPVIFRRRTPEESRIVTHDSLVSLYDFMRMLDAEGYPKAFCEYRGYRYEFSRAAFYDGEIIADVRIKKAD